MMKHQCSRCTFEFNAEFQQCPRCGQSVTANTKRAAQENKTPAAPSTKRDRGRSGPPPPPAGESPISGSRIAMVLILSIVGVFLIAVFSGDNTSSNRAPTRSRPPAPPAVVTTQYHVVAEMLNIRSGTTTESAVLYQAKKWDTLEVLGINDGWAEIRRSGGAKAFASARYLAKENGRQAQAQDCIDNAGRTPSNGEIFGRRLRSGGFHEFRLKGGSSATVVKMKNRAGDDVLSFFVAPNRSVLIKDIPDGDYLVYFASGGTWSRSCGKFMRDMQVTRDPNPVRLTGNNQGQYYTFGYELTEQVGGNFRPTDVSNDSF